MPDRIFVTGASGMLGFELLRFAKYFGRSEVIGIARRDLPSGQHDLPLILTKLPLIPDWLGPQDADATIIHCAGLANPRKPFEDFASLSHSEIIPQVAMVEALVAKGWRGHLIYPSSGGAIYGDAEVLPICEETPVRPKSPYALQKAMIEQGLSYLALRHGFRLTILRISNPYGSSVVKPEQGVLSKMVEAVRTGASFTLIGTGDEMRDYIHISDLCDAVVKVCSTQFERPVNVINIGSGVGTSTRDLMDLVCRLSGKTLTLTVQDSTLDVRSNVLKIGRARNLLQWSPKMHINQGVALFIETAKC